MKLRSLHINESIDPIKGLEENLAGKTMIFISLKATDPNPKLRYAQIIHITAVAVGADTGTEVGSFNEEAELEIGTMSRLKYEDNLKANGEWPPGQMAVRDWLNAGGYDLASVESGAVQKPSDLEVAMAFKDFYDSYDRMQIIVAHNVPFVVNHLNHVLPHPLRISQDIDTLEFAHKYFMPVLRLKMMSGHDTSNKIGEKMLDNRGNLVPSTHNLSRAFNVGRTKHRISSVEDVRQLARVFYKMLNFVRLHRDMLEHPDFIRYAQPSTQPAELDSESEEELIGLDPEPESKRDFSEPQF